MNWRTPPERTCSCGPRAGTNDAARWYGELARVIEKIGERDLPDTLVAALDRLVPFDHSVMFAYRGEEPPVSVFDTFDTTQRDLFVSEYQEGPYRLDPFCQLCSTPFKPGLYRLYDLLSCDLRKSEYFRRYYWRTRLAEEIGFVVPLTTDGRTVVISLMRSGGRPHFSGEEIRLLRAIEPVVRASAARQWGTEAGNGVTQPGSAAGGLDPEIRNQMARFGAGVLTRREREVVGLILRGCSSQSIAERLRISVDTVKTHRKNLYAKLGVSSESALLRRFLTSLSRPAVARFVQPRADDPRNSYS